MTTYLVDANVFIQAKNLHYGFEFFPAFWDWLIEQNHAGKIASIRKVADELQGSFRSGVRKCRERWTAGSFVDFQGMSSFHRSNRISSLGMNGTGDPPSSSRWEFVKNRWSSVPALFEEEL